MQIEAGGGHWKSWLFLGLIILFVVSVRVRLLDFPLERDEGEYAYMGQLMLQGTLPYVSAYNMKFPGTYAMYALIMAVFGQSIHGIHLGFILVNCASILLVYFLARSFAEEPGALAAAAAYALLSLSPSVLGFAAHATHFVVLPALAGVLTLLVALRDKRPYVYFLSGVLFGLALLMKQPGVFFLLFGLAYIILHHYSNVFRIRVESSLDPRVRPEGDNLKWLFLFVIPAGLKRESTKPDEHCYEGSYKNLAIRLGIFTAGGALPFLITAGCLYAAGAFDKFWFWTIRYASEYGSQIPLSAAFDVFKENMALVAEGHLVFWVMAVAGFISLFFYKGLKGGRSFIALFTFFSFLTICPGFYFRQHYFITLLPAVALLTGIFVDRINDKAASLLKTRYAKFAGVMIFVLASGVAIASEKGYLFEDDTVRLSREIYGANPFPEALGIARFIKAESRPEDKVAVFGSEPEIYFYSGRHAATGYIYTYGLMEYHPYALEMQKEMIREIETSRPRFIVAVKIATSWLIRPASERYIFGWFEGYVRNNYRLAGVVDIISGETTVYKWHADAQGYVIQSPSHVLIFEKTGK